MKRHLLALSLTAVAMLIAGCCKQQNFTTPIMPIHYTGDSTLVVITDYLPFLNEGDKVEITTDGHYSFITTANGNIFLFGDNNLANIHFSTSKGEYDVPIIPRLEVVQALTTVDDGATDDAVTIEERGLFTYDEIILAYKGNTLLDEDAVEGIEPESRRIHLPKGGKGREYLRVYAQFDNLLTNDLLGMTTKARCCAPFLLTVSLTAIQTTTANSTPQKCLMWWIIKAGTLQV